MLYPVYKGSYERASVPFPTIRIPTERRDLIIQFTKDFLRSVDYLQTRQDIDNHNLGFVGISMGAQRGPHLLALEDRMKTGILIHGGLIMAPQRPELDPFNFASHVTIPILMMNGRFDATYPGKPLNFRCWTCSVHRYRTSCVLSTKEATKAHPKTS